MHKARLIDIHTHGIGKFETRSGRTSDILSMAELHGQAGTAAIVPTVYCASIDKMRQDLEAIAVAMRQQTAKGSARILGAHLEGPFINPAKCGALDASSVLDPSVSKLKQLIKGYENIIRVITMAPELRGASRVIEQAVSLGIKVSMGHSDATHAQAKRGKKAGATCVTHLFNAMPPLHHREPGLAGFALMDDEMHVEIIADRIHICPEALDMVFRLKDHRKVIAVSDSIMGPMKRGGVLQGGGSPLEEARATLKGIGLPEKSIHLVMGGNAARFLGV